MTLLRLITDGLKFPVFEIQLSHYGSFFSVFYKWGIVMLYRPVLKFMVHVRLPFGHLV